MMMIRYFQLSILLYVLTALNSQLHAQSSTLRGKVTSDNQPIEFAKVLVLDNGCFAETDSLGKFLLQNVPLGFQKIIVLQQGYKSFEEIIYFKSNDSISVHFRLIFEDVSLDEVVVSGTMKEVSKSDSPVPIEVYTAKFFKRNPSPTIFDALQNINGVRPQINCNVCNTGDIHINGLEGPYTMVLIDGMPLVSGLSTVYGLSGIPQSLIDRVEIVKGPASTLYGSEAVGGLINIITKKTASSPIFSSDIFATSWGEVNSDLAYKFQLGNKLESTIGLNYFVFQNKVDNNIDGFTDMTLQNRISVFNKWTIRRKYNRVFNFAGRFINEDRWGGDLNWSKKFRGGDSIYGESIYTKRWEFFGTYQFPLKEKIMLQSSANGHFQNSAYGQTFFLAKQMIGFIQIYWNKYINRHDLLAGTTIRYTYYRDDTSVSYSVSTLNSFLPGVFLQDEISINECNKLLLGLRYDYHSLHGNILTPRLNYKWNSRNKKNTLRVSVGNGYRVANVFTEDHAALTGARKVVFLADLKPETSWNSNVNFVKRIEIGNSKVLDIDVSLFYTYFTNKIIANYELDPQKIIYDNLAGFSVSQGASFNIDFTLVRNLKANIGGTFMNVYSVINGKKSRQLFSEHFTGVWNIGYSFHEIGLTIDYNGNVYSPMRLPLQNALDPRKEYSPWWSIQNIQITKSFKKGFEIYAGIKNLLNWTPNKGNPFIIARSNDPFNKQVQFDAEGKVLTNSNNPYGLIFDPSYTYGPNQGIRGFVGFRYVFGGKK